MSFVYVQRTGSMYGPGGGLVEKGYSGHGHSINSPIAEAAVGVGPIPTGEYVIGPPHMPIDHLGPLAMPLWPNKANEMHGRSGFFIHGDNQKMNHTASNGCIILSRTARQSISNNPDKHLLVVAEETDVP